MYDIHSHILPNIDDGPHGMEDSVAMARIAKNDGTKKMICTPNHKDVTENHSILFLFSIVMVTEKSTLNWLPMPPREICCPVQIWPMLGPN